MSKVAIQGNASGTGTLTIAAPSTNTDRTLTLPDEAGTVDTLQRAGNVLQVVKATYSTYTQISSTSYVDTGLSASITPTSATSKVLVLVNQTGWTGRDSSYGAVYYVNLVRDSTEISNNSYEYRAGLAGDGRIRFPVSSNFMFLDTPSTTSSTTYKTQVKLDTTADSALMRLHLVPSVDSIVLLEIAA